MTTRRSDTHTVNLALQGGGAHGAFTWGVLDCLLEDGRLAFEGVSGTSAGAMNAVVLAHGLLTGGRDGAREALSTFWTAVADSAPFIAYTPKGDDAVPVVSPMLTLMLQLADHFSPDQLNPFDLNPLRDILEQQIDFARLRQESPVDLFIATTRANSGKLRVWRSSELSVDTVLASACLPTIHHTVVIDGEPYWDGGYSANPAVFPLFYHCESPDILLVLLTPLRYDETPCTASDIKARQRELSFQSTFLREMRAFANLQEHAAGSWITLGRLERRISRVRFHVIAADDLMNGLPQVTKLVADRRFFAMLRDKGRAHAKAWLESHWDAVGKRSTVELPSLFC
jgi:NTE family protein